jgi:hypothetical protein
MKRTTIFTLLSLVAVITCMNCSNSPVAGNGSDVGNALVVGYLYNQNGSTAPNAIVRFIPSSQMSFPTLPKKEVLSYAAVTNAEGKFGLDSLPRGFYSVLGEGTNGNLSFMDSVYINLNTKTIVPSDTLKAPGSLSGVIRLADGQDSRNAFMLIFGLGTFAAPKDSIGNFTLDNMAEGEYHIRILATGNSYQPFDTLLSIRAGMNDTLTDTIHLQPYTLQAPVIISAKAGSAISATLLWTRVQSAVAYDVYKSDSISGQYAFAGRTIDTSYSDGSIESGSLRYYRIQASNGAQSSPFSAIDSVLTMPKPPLNVRAVSLGDTAVSLNWSPCHGADVYWVYRNLIDTLAHTVDTFYILSKDAFRSASQYYVRALNKSGGSSIKAIDIFFPPIPQQPDSAWMTAISDSTIKIQWSSCSGAATYCVLAPNTLNSTIDTLVKTADTFCMVTGVDYRLSPQYSVAAANIFGISAGTPVALVPLGTVLCSKPFYAFADSATPLSLLFESNGMDMAFAIGDIIQISAIGITPVMMTVNAGSHIEDLRAACESALQQIDPGITIMLSNGKMIIHNGSASASISNFSLSSSKQKTTLVLDAVFKFPATIISGATESSLSLYRPAKESDLLCSLYGNDTLNSEGEMIPLGLETGDIISITSPDSTTYPPYHIVVSTTATTLQDLCLAIRIARNLPANDGTILNNPSVSVFSPEIKDILTGNWAKYGAVIARGQPGDLTALNWLLVIASNSDNNATAPWEFWSTMLFNELQPARN